MFPYIALTLIAAANCVPVPQATNWTGVEHRFQVIRDGAFPRGFAEVIALALKENPELGSEIAEMVGRAEVEAYAILDRAIGPIEAQNLTKKEANTILYEYDGRVMDLHDEIAENVQKLSSQVRDTWGKMYYFYSYFDWWTYGQIFYLLLDLPLVETDWVAAAQTMESVSSIVGQAVSYIKEVAYSENPEIGDAITPILDAAFGVTIDNLDLAQRLIRNESWTLAEAVGFFADYRSRDSSAAAELEPYLSQLSNDALWAILIVSHETSNAMHGIALTIYDNIGQVDRFGCCSDTQDPHDKHLEKLRNFKELNK